MKIEFNIFRLNKESETYLRWLKMPYMKQWTDCDFIVVNKEKFGDEQYLSVQPVQEQGVTTFGGMKFNESGFHVPQNDLVSTNEIVELDIPKKYLTVKIIEDMQELNERLMKEK